MKINLSIDLEGKDAKHFLSRLSKLNSTETAVATNHIPLLKPIKNSEIMTVEEWKNIPTLQKRAKKFSKNVSLRASPASVPEEAEAWMPINSSMRVLRGGSHRRLSMTPAASWDDAPNNRKNVIKLFDFYNKNIHKGERMGRGDLVTLLQKIEVFGSMSPTKLSAIITANLVVQS